MRWISVHKLNEQDMQDNAGEYIYIYIYIYGGLLYFYSLILNKAKQKGYILLAFTNTSDVFLKKCIFCIPTHEYPSDS